jgi:hypothetical protein
MPKPHMQQGFNSFYNMTELVMEYADGESLLVNWCEVTIKRMCDGKVLYHNAWVTLHHLEDKILSRWV